MTVHPDVVARGFSEEQRVAFLQGFCAGMLFAFDMCRTGVRVAFPWRTAGRLVAFVDETERGLRRDELFRKLKPYMFDQGFREQLIKGLLDKPLKPPECSA